MKVGAVVIGRNEAVRLERAIRSVALESSRVVFVDSGSTDDSVRLARALEVDVVELDDSGGFSAARARNAGLARLIELHPDLEWVQFLDADSALAGGWLATGVAHLEANPAVAVVCGRIRERQPDRSVYHQLRHIGWDSTLGEISSCPGTLLARIASIRSIEGFAAHLRAGEDYELCLRLRRKGGKIVRLDVEMAVHDAGTLGVRDWWRRAARDGYGYAEIAALYRGDPDALWQRDVRSAWFWGLWFPVSMIFAVAIVGWTGWMLGIAYLVLTARIYGKERRERGARDAGLYAASCVLAKFPQVVGQVRFSFGIDSTPAGESSRKVAYLISQYPMPTHTFIQREIRALESHGVDVTRISVRETSGADAAGCDPEELERTRAILSIGFGGLLRATLRAGIGQPVRFVRALALAVRVGWASNVGVLRHLIYFAEACVLQKWLRDSAVRHLHAHFATNPAAVALLSRVLGGPPYSFSIHGTAELEIADGLALPAKVENSEFVIAASEFVREQVLNWIPGHLAPRLHVVRCGLDEEFLVPRPSVVPSENKFVCVARLDEKKGQLLLLDAVACLTAQGQDCHLTLVGDGPLRRPLEARIEKLGLRQQVELVGWAGAREVRRHIEDSRALVLPSLSEGLPVVITESLALGRPVVCTDVGGVRELVEPGVTGWVVTPGSVDALTRALTEVMGASTADLSEMGRRGARRVAREYNAKTETERIVRLLLGGESE